MMKTSDNNVYMRSAIYFNKTAEWDCFEFGHTEFLKNPGKWEMICEQGARLDLVWHCALLGFEK